MTEDEAKKKCFEYVDKWRAIDGKKPSNDKEFAYYFLEYMIKSDCSLWSFEGENHYCGWTAYLFEDDSRWRNQFNFEFAYGDDFVKVFDANNDGYWVPEYIDLKGGDAGLMLVTLKRKLNEWANL